MITCWFTYLYLPTCIYRVTPKAVQISPDIYTYRTHIRDVNLAELRKELYFSIHRIERRRRPTSNSNNAKSRNIHTSKFIPLDTTWFIDNFLQEKSVTVTLGSSYPNFRIRVAKFFQKNGLKKGVRLE